MQRGSALIKETWVTALAVCDMLGLMRAGRFIMLELSALEHRAEYLGAYNGTHFYNDSKSTIFEATYAMVTSLAPQKIHLLLGGLSKGVDRTALISQLKGTVVSTACFGKEAELLASSCQAEGIRTSSHKTLESALKESIKKAEPHDVILLSPAGSSYDLYSNYIERGKHFKELVKKFATIG